MIPKKFYWKLQSKRLIGMKLDIDRIIFRRSKGAKRMIQVEAPQPHRIACSLGPETRGRRTVALNRSTEFPILPVKEDGYGPILRHGTSQRWLLLATEDVIGVRSLHSGLTPCSRRTSLRTHSTRATYRAPSMAGRSSRHSEAANIAITHDHRHGTRILKNRPRSLSRPK